MLVYFFIFKPKNFIPLLFKPCISAFIRLPCSGIMVALPNQFDDKALFETEKIHSVAANRMLPSEFASLYLPVSDGLPKYNFC